MIRITAVIVSLLLLTSCATGIDPKNLTPASRLEGFILNERIEHHGKTRLIEVKEGLKKGEYKAEFEDKEGVYYRGPGKCVTFDASTGYKADSEGGLWLPKPGVEIKPRVYAYILAENNPTSIKDGLLIKGLIENDYGRISFGADINDSNFIGKIKIIGFK